MKLKRLGALLLTLPVATIDRETLGFVDALFTATSAVCVTGLTVVDAGDTFTALGQFFLAVLIQIGGLGVTSISAGVILAMGRRVNLKGRMLIRESMNLDAGRGLIGFVYTVFKTTLLIELIGAALSFIVFIQDYSLFRAIGVSLFHSVASFNNAGFDILGTKNNLYYRCFQRHREKHRTFIRFPRISYIFELLFFCR